MDSSGGFVAVAFICGLLFATHEIDHVEGKRSLLTQHMVQVNKTYHDDVYDCVDFYKQPAFDHPLLANHSFHHEMRPSSTPILRDSKNKQSLHMEFQFKGKNCPTGTVPIRRITTEDRIRQRLHFEKYGSEYSVLDAKNPGTHYATVRTRSGPTQKYNGAAAKISIWNPTVQNSQYSSNQIIIRNGHENLQVGWTVNPTLYGDNRSYLFIYTSAAGSTQCFNTHCPGFVIVNKNIPIDGPLTGDKPDGKTYYVRVMIEMDAKDGNWWLKVGQYYEPVGFWPKSIFTNLVGMAASAEWGGLVYSPPNVPSPPMGSGKFIAGDSKKDAYCGLVSIINEEHQVVDALNIDPYVDTTRYQIKQLGNVGMDFGILVLFGGPGGVTGN